MDELFIQRATPIYVEKIQALQSSAYKSEAIIYGGMMHYQRFVNRCVILKEFLKPH